MSKYVSIIFLTVMVSVILFFIFGSFYMGGGDPTEEAIFAIGTIIVILLSFLISQVSYLIRLIRKNR